MPHQKFAKNIESYQRVANYLRQSGVVDLTSVPIWRILYLMGYNLRAGGS